uniref:Uncharacterized protein n=1 Tax=Anopheles atroparvus TaxID=41427 RepID=A0A182JE95_ANOAO
MNHARTPRTRRRWSVPPASRNGLPSTTPGSSAQTECDDALLLERGGLALAQYACCRWPVSMFHTYTSLLPCEADTSQDDSVGWCVTRRMRASCGCLISAIGSWKRRSQQMCRPLLVPTVSHELLGSMQNVVMTPLRRSLCRRQAQSGMRMSQPTSAPYSVAYTITLWAPWSSGCISTTGPSSGWQAALTEPSISRWRACCSAILLELVSILSSSSVPSLPATASDWPASQAATACSGVLAWYDWRDLFTDCCPSSLLQSHRRTVPSMEALAKSEPTWGLSAAIRLTAALCSCRCATAVPLRRQLGGSSGEARLDSRSSRWRWCAANRVRSFVTSVSISMRQSASRSWLPVARSGRLYSTRLRLGVGSSTVVAGVSTDGTAIVAGPATDDMAIVAPELAPSPDVVGEFGEDEWESIAPSMCCQSWALSDSLLALPRVPPPFAPSCGGPVMSTPVGPVPLAPFVPGPLPSSTPSGTSPITSGK